MPKNTERLQEVGPVDPRTGYPLWYEDATGTRVDLAWQRGDPNTPVIADLDESGPLRGIADFPGESFYMIAEAELPIGAGSDEGFVRVVLALEATFATEDVLDGEQIVFGRIRFRVRDGLPETTYILTHPYGTVEATTDDRGRVTATEDIGLSPLDFTGALGGQIAPFLRWTADPALPNGYIGDGNTPHTVTGSPFNTNFALVEGPGVGSVGSDPDPSDPGNPDKVYTDLFVLQGRIATVHGAEITRAVYTQDAAGAVTVDVFARSVAGQQLVVSADGLAETPMQGGITSNYTARISAGNAVPGQVTVTNRTDPVSLPVTVGLVDAVEVSQADYDSANQTLTVTATSSDALGAPVLTVTGRGGLSGSPGAFGLDAPPAAITVTSSAGGADTRPVKVVG
ncbi:hypothetical protein [Kocuria rosea]|uniref:hypothetical protein n=1 Tax=Kocuria rosea TaxID=1275 RepID=UPI00203FAA04|nr:hypothetical protein [Kocuria rosea]